MTPDVPTVNMFVEWRKSSKWKTLASFSSLMLVFPMDLDSPPTSNYKGRTHLPGPYLPPEVGSLAGLPDETKVIWSSVRITKLTIQITVNNPSKHKSTLLTLSITKMKNIL